MFGNFGRRSPSPLRNQIGGLRNRGVGRIIPPAPPPPPPSEPDKDEAFVHETGIKLFTSRPPCIVQRRPSCDDDVPEELHEDDEEEEEEDDDEDEDDCYEIIMDDAIIEEDGEDDDEDNDDPISNSNDNSEKENIDIMSNKKHPEGKLKEGNNKEVQDKLSASKLQLSNSNRSSSGISSNDSSTGNVALNSSSSGSANSVVRRLSALNLDLPNYNFPNSDENLLEDNGSNDKKCVDCTTQERKLSCQSCKSIESNSSIEASSEGSAGSVKLVGSLSSSLKGLDNIISSPPPSAGFQSGGVSSSAHTTPTKEPTTEFLFRGKSARSSLPIRDRFITRPTAEQVAGQVGKEVSLRPIRTIWFRRANKPIQPTVSDII